MELEINKATGIFLKYILAPSTQQHFLRAPLRVSAPIESCLMAEVGC